jgi:hypothetical protein
MNGAWMAQVPDDQPLGSIRIPGTHNSAADRSVSSASALGVLGGSFLAQCQDLTIAEQLERGVRYIDIRLKLDGDTLRVYHGPCFCGHTFADILVITTAFLRQRPSEVIIMEVHREDSGFSTRRRISDSSFMVAVNDSLAPYRDLIAADGAPNPALRDVRGKLMLVSFKHVEDAQSLLHFRIFPVCKNWQSYRCRATDAGRAGKLQAFERGMAESLVSEILFVNEGNAVGSVPVLAFLPNPRRMAEAVNEEVEQMIGRIPFRGVVQLDFPEATRSQSLIGKVIQANFSDAG